MKKEIFVVLVYKYMKKKIVLILVRFLILVEFLVFEYLCWLILLNIMILNIFFKYCNGFLKKYLVGLCLFFK